MPNQIFSPNLRPFVLTEGETDVEHIRASPELLNQYDISTSSTSTGWARVGWVAPQAGDQEASTD